MIKFELEPVTDSGHIKKFESQKLSTEQFSFAFGKATAVEIKNRANWICEVSGRRYEDGWKMDASHRYTHDKNDPKYNDPDNGICLSLPEHLKQHIDIYKDSLLNGYTQDYKDWARASVQLIARRSYRDGLRTLDHYAAVPLDIIDDRDLVIEILTDNDLDPAEFIL